MTKPGMAVEETDKRHNAVLEDAPSAGKRWRVGTLSYTQAQLMSVFFWLLWGDFCLNVMEFVIPRLVPPALGRLGASNALIAILTGSLFSAMNWLMNPWISTWSDRHRGPRGRRVPFMLWPTPALAAAVIFVGFAGNLGAWVWKTWPGVGAGLAHFFSVVLPDMTGLTPAAQIGIGMIAVALVLYKFFDEFPQCVYYYIWADVVPQEVMGRFTSLFRVFAAAAGFVFHRWILVHAEHHTGAIYIGCALLYLTAFMLLSLLVKEGEYPPPPAKVRRTDKVLEEVSHWKDQGRGVRWFVMRTAVGVLVWIERLAGECGTPRYRLMRPVVRMTAAGVFVLKWALECFTNSYYWKYFGVYACFRWAYVPFNNLIVMYATKGAGVSEGDFARAMSWAQLAQVPVFLLLGPVVDRYHPIRVGVVGFVALTASGVLGFFLTHDAASLRVWLIGAFVAFALFQAGLVSMGPRLLPRSRYGQFCAATMMVVESGVMVLSWVCGKMMDVLGDRYLWLWLTLCGGLGVVATVLLYRAWKHEGGDEAYVAPGGFDVTPCDVKASS